MTHQERRKEKTILSFFKKGETSKRNASSSPVRDASISIEEIPGSSSNPPPSKSQRVELDDILIELKLERDPALRIPIWKHPINQQDEVRRAYINMGPYQPRLEQYPLSKFGNQNRSFQYNWFQKFTWLEYSPSKNAAFCFPCFVFDINPTRYPAFIVEGFSNWKRVNNGGQCYFLIHQGCPSSPHNNSVNSVLALKNVPRHIDNIIIASSEEEIQKNRLRLGTTIKVVKFLTLQGLPLRGHHEYTSSKNRGNFLAGVKYTAYLREDINAVVLENAPGNAKFTSPLIQKDVLHILANAVRNKIHEEIGVAKFCLLVNESKDFAKREQMAIVLRFVDAQGFVQERFFDIVHVTDTTASNLKKEICASLIRSNVNVNNLRGQGYDGASNMSGIWNDLQALFLRDCPSAYYIHCFAHRLQLALVHATEKQRSIKLFFNMLTTIVNLVTASAKRHTELQSNQAIEIVDSIATGERETGKGANQIGTLQRAGATRWSSHFDSICSLIDMYKAVTTLLGNIADDESQNNYAEAFGAFNEMRSFEFMFILYTMHQIMGITCMLCRALQQKQVDILNAMDLVSTTKDRLSLLRSEGFYEILEYVKKVCLKYDIDVPDMSARYREGTGRSCQQKDIITVEHHYHFDLFNDAIDFQVEELNRRFNDEAVELLKLSSSLDPRDNFKSFNIVNISNLAEKFYPLDFTEQEMHFLKAQLDQYAFDLIKRPMFQGLSTLSELCQKLAETKLNQIYYLIDRLIRLILTLPVSTATSERKFSAMKHVKSVLRNKMENEFLADSLIVYIERELSESIGIDFVIDEFNSQKHRRVQLK